MSNLKIKVSRDLETDSRSSFGTRDRVSSSSASSSVNKEADEKVDTEQETSENIKLSQDTFPKSDRAPEHTSTQAKGSNEDADYVDKEANPYEDRLSVLPYTSPAQLLAIHFKPISSGEVQLNGWQLDQLEELAESFKYATAKVPYKLALAAANGSGKDSFIIAPFLIWACLTSIKSRWIVTTASGTQLTSQTEPYLKALAESINEFYGEAYFKIRQRYIRCLKTGSEIRLFATDEAGKAEGYHPIEPNRFFGIIVNEAKSIREEIITALRRCSGYTHWLYISSPGDVKGSFYRACTSWQNFRRVTSYDCQHVSEPEREEDRKEYGETSAYYRSKHLALFTSMEGKAVIPSDFLARIKTMLDDDSTVFNPKRFLHWPKRVGIDLAAGGDETSLRCVRGANILEKLDFRETDTTITATRIDEWLRVTCGLSKKHQYIYADDGGIGHAIIDMLETQFGWSIIRVNNAFAAFNKNHYGNLGAENWDRVKRLIEEKLICPDFDDDILQEQLMQRAWKQNGSRGRYFLQSKREAKAEGKKSPDRADAYILAYSDITVEDFLNDKGPDFKPDDLPVRKLQGQEAIMEYYRALEHGQRQMQIHDGKQQKHHGSLQVLLDNRNN